MQFNENGEELGEIGMKVLNEAMFGQVVLNPKKKEEDVADNRYVPGSDMHKAANEVPSKMGWDATNKAQLETLINSLVWALMDVRTTPEEQKNLEEKVFALADSLKIPREEIAKRINNDYKEEMKTIPSGL